MFVRPTLQLLSLLHLGLDMKATWGIPHQHQNDENTTYVFPLKFCQLPTLPAKAGDIPALLVTLTDVDDSAVDSLTKCKIMFNCR
jgi:hypothetical protein